MKPTDGYILRNIRGSHYLIPMGQNVALHKRCIKLNDSAVFLWRALKQGLSEDKLLPLLAKHYQTKEEDLSLLQEDMDSFIRLLTSLQLLSKEVCPYETTRYIKIGNLVVRYQGPEQLLHPSFNDFSCEADEVGQHWLIIPQHPDSLPKGELLVRTSEIEIYKNEEDYIISIYSFSKMLEIRVSLDGKYARFFCPSLLDENLIEMLFHAFRYAFFIYAQKMEVFPLHSSSILYKDKVWLFSAPSGTGKSTQACYWHEHFQTPIINGDLNLIHIEPTGPKVWGLPWCGTSQIYTEGIFPLGGIVLLKQDNTNKIEKLNKTNQLLSITQRLISPTWTEEMLDSNLEFCDKLIECVLAFRYLCRNEPAAADYLRQYIDNENN